MTGSWWRDDAVAWEAEGWSIEVRGDELAEIRHHGRAVLRGVRPAVRDSGWMTVGVEVDEIRTAATSLTLRLRHDGLGARIASTLSVQASDDELTIEWDAVNEAAFDTCRTGLVVLHPASDAGTPTSIVHPDGSLSTAAFPTEISPHQPMMDIRELRVGDDTVLRFAGDVFEMEDQRNWTDASFKTYSRPLALPFPYRLEEGERVQQSVTISITDSTIGTSAATASTDAVIDLAGAGGFPSVGVEASTAPDPVPVSAAGAFRVVELDLRTPTWPTALARAAADDRGLDVRIVTDGDADALADAARALVGRDVLRVTAFHADDHVSDEPTVAALRAALRGAGLAVPVLAGSRSHFTEFNREQHRIPRDVDGIAVNTTALFHSLDTEQLVEAVSMQRLIAEQTVRLAGGPPVHIGPISLRPRFNDVATTPQALACRADLSEGYGAEFTGAVDARQDAPELAAWVIGSAAALAVPGVASLSWFETWGSRGLQDATGAKPVDAAVSALASLVRGTLLTGASPDGLVWAIGSRGHDGTVVLAANLDRTARRVTVRFPEGAAETVELDAGSWTRIQRPVVDARTTSSGRNRTRRS